MNNFTLSKSHKKTNFGNKFKKQSLFKNNRMKIKQHLGFISMLALAFTACQQKPAETDNFLENEIKNIEAQHTLQTDLIEKVARF